MIPIIWSAAARRDLAAIDDYYRDIDPVVAQRMGRQAIASARFLAERPGAGPAVPNTAFRKWPVPRSPYMLIYRVSEGRLDVVRLVHHASDWQSRP